VNRSLRVGMVCPYSLDVPGGVQAHVIGLAGALTALGHRVQVLAPAADATRVPEFVTSTGRAIAVPYNGSVARVTFGPLSYARTRRWLADHQFDVLHLHEPTTMSVSAMTLFAAEGPIVVTFHTSTERSRALNALGGFIRPLMEKVTARIAVSPLARRVQVEHLGGGAWEIPNGVSVDRYTSALPLPSWPGEGGAIGFVGRYSEPRKGFGVLLDAFTQLARRRPGLRLLVAGKGEPDEALKGVPSDVARRVVFLGMVPEEEKARMLRSVDAYVAPNTGGESFGMILTEAMAAGTPVVASDLDAFRRVLDGGRAGVLVPVGDAAALAAALARLLDSPQERAELQARATEVVSAYDWPVVALRVLEVYTFAIEATPREARASAAPQ
jgi:phosphatidylinositol alpha-mannosyltransferase